ncbi:MAG: hypothetical protein O3C63_01340 [Cyanobacteria bacterium]|nr:hypothetical protein [Cyanobacteriota bacterium]MDA1020720.1 hypothetical protein [Cyanobacteriota bacterium]
MKQNLKIVLAISIMINLVLAGVIIGHYSHSFKENCRRKPAKHFSQRLLGIKEGNQAKHLEMKALRDDLFNILTAETFDAEAYQVKLDALRKLHHVKMEMISNKIKEMAMTMDQAQRKELAKEMRRLHGHKKHRIH